MTTYVDEMRTELLGYAALDPEILAFMRKRLPRIIAEELVGVQPMDEGGKAFEELYQHLKATNKAFVFSSNFE
ncbi:hypothetical protein [Xanthomonas phage X1]|nr:hypothetical protein [Xanthomonas phage X1]